MAVSQLTVRLPSAPDDETGGCFDDCIGIDAVGAIQIRDVAGLTELLDAQRHDSLTLHRSKP